MINEMYMVKNIVKRNSVLEHKSDILNFNKKENDKINTLKENQKSKSIELNNIKEKEEDMNKNDLSKANDIISSMNKGSNIKKIKSEKGLIERIENEKIVLTEDNKMLLKD